MYKVKHSLKYYGMGHSWFVVISSEGTFYKVLEEDTIDPQAILEVFC